MAKTIMQKIVFKNTTPKILYNLYMNVAKHQEATGAPAQIEAKEGTSFTAYDKYIAGTNTKLVKDNLIVQSWRGADWDSNSPDSTLILNFEAKGDNVTVHLVQSNLPDEKAESIDKGWHEFYWTPWKKYLKEIAK